MRSSLILSEKGIETIVQLTCPAHHISQTSNFLIDTGFQRIRPHNASIEEVDKWIRSFVNCYNLRRRGGLC